MPRPGRCLNNLWVMSKMLTYRRLVHVCGVDESTVRKILDEWYAMLCVNVSGKKKKDKANEV